MIKTQIFIMRIKGDGREIQKIEIPTNDPNGFYGTIELKLQAGKMITNSVPLQHLPVLNFTIEEWEKNFGGIEDN